MINVKVKTLDSQNHDFDVDEENTVRQFKEHIAEKLTISADMQRLIYCGRVLMDEKQLKEYDLNGKVVHLVQRSPPGRPSSQDASAGERRRTDTPRRNFRTADPFNIENLFEGMMVDGRVLAIPAQTAALSPSSTLCQNRITVARHMLNCADNIAAYLEDPQRGLNNAAMDILAQQTMESTVFEVGISAVGDIDLPQQQVQNLMQAFQGAVSATFRQNGIQNITVQQNPDSSAAAIPTIQVFGTIPHVGGTAPTQAGGPTQENVTAPPPSQDTAPQPPQEEQPQTQQQQQQQQQPRRHQTTSTQTLAEVVQQMRNVQERLNPFIRQYHEILQNDPIFDTQEVREANQRVFDRVSEALHYMSHAQHAISDLMLDLSSERPRHLTCRPILVEQSAFLSSGIAVPSNNPNIANLLRNAAVAQQQQQQQPNNNNAGEIPATTTTINIPIPIPFPIPDSRNADSGVANNPAGNGGNNEQGQSQDDSSVASLYIPIYNRPMMPNERRLRPVAVITRREPMNQTEQREGNNEQNQTQNENENLGASISSASSNQVTRLIQAALNAAGPMNVQVVRGPVINQENSGNNPNAGGTVPPFDGGIDAGIGRPTQRPPQMRGLRPIPANMLSSFDRFLPCNSHHVPENSQNQQRQQQQQQQARSGEQSPEQQMHSMTNEEYSTPLTLFGTQLTLRDFINVAPTATTLNRIRHQILDFIRQNLFAGRPIATESMDAAVDATIINLLPYLTSLEQYERPDYDARASIERLIRSGMPTIINLVEEDTSEEFGIRFLRELITFTRRLFVILVTTIGQQNSRTYLNRAVDMTIPILNGPMRIFQRYIESAILNTLNALTTDTEDVQQFLVNRRPASAPAATSTPTPMDTDEPQIRATTIEPAMTTATTATEIPANDYQRLREALETPPMTESQQHDLPSVSQGSEAWHTHFSSQWLPIITRDIEAQRSDKRTQEPFSDAYLSSMTPKRRKILVNSKPSTEVNQLLSSGIKKAVEKNISNSAGTSSARHPVSMGNPSMRLDDIAANISTDSTIQARFREHLRQNVKERAEDDKDFNSERFPNCSKICGNQNSQ